MSILQEAEFWVFIGLLLFFGLLIFLKVPSAATRALDARGAKIQAALDEAQRLRDEARVLLASIKARHEASEAQAADMLNEAQLEAQRLSSEAKAKLEEQIARRTALADRRIALAESQAAQDVKAAAVELAAELAQTALAERIANAKTDPMIDQALGELAVRLQ